MFDLGQFPYNPGLKANHNSSAFYDNEIIYLFLCTYVINIFS